MFDKFLYIHTSLCMYFFLGAINDSFVWSNSDLKKLFDSGEFGDYLLVGEYLLFFVLCFCKYVSLFFCQLTCYFNICTFRTKLLGCAVHYTEQ